MTPRLEVNDLSTWTLFRKSLCKGCYAHCCTFPVEVTVADLQRMEVISPEEALLSIRKIAKILIDKGLVRSYRIRQGLFTLEQRPNGDCVFLGNKRLCMVYEKRPQVCRRFPALGPRPGYCPEQRKPKTGDGIYQDSLKCSRKISSASRFSP